jgi:outer membrane biosynthesis protein TonB
MLKIILSLEEHLNVSKERVASRKEIKALRNKAAAEERAKLPKLPKQPKEPKEPKEPKVPKVPKVPKEPKEPKEPKIKKKPEQMERYSADRRVERAHSRIAADENSYSVLNRTVVGKVLTNKASSFEEKINRDAVNYEVSKIYLL